MRKAIGSLLFFLALGCAWGQSGAEELVGEGAGYLLQFFKGRADARVAVVQFENESELSDTAMQKIYQMLVSRLEGQGSIRVVDLLVAFSSGRGEFNLSQANDLDFLIDLKLIQNKIKTGLGLTVFSRLQDRVVAIRYFEKALSQGEKDLLSARHFAFSAMGFSKLLEFETRPRLMDIQSVADAQGQWQYFFYYPDEIVIYTARESRLERHFQFKLRWERPSYPVLHPEGKLLLLSAGPDLMLTAGGNFSPYSQVLTYRGGVWQEAGKIDFVPLRLVTMNRNPYLVGARYEEGRNFFKDRVYFLPFDNAEVRSGAVERKVPPAMSLDFSSAGGELQALHLIDRDYGYHLLTAAFEEKSPLEEKRGASLAVLDGQWLAMSDFARSGDQLFFYDIRDGGLRAVYAAQIAGQVQFLSAGNWQNAKGFWAGVRQTSDGGERLQVQFWGKRDE